MMVQMKMILMFNKYRTMIIKEGELILSDSVRSASRLISILKTGFSS